MKKSSKNFPCPGCPHPDRCKALGTCAMEKAQKGFMGDKYAKRKMK